MPLTDQDVVTGGAPVLPAVAAAGGAGGSTPTSTESTSTPRNRAAAAQQFERQPVPAHALDHSAVISLAIGDLSVQPAALQPEYFANHVIPVLLANPNRHFARPTDTATTTTNDDSAAGDTPQRGYGKLAYLPGSQISPSASANAGGSSSSSSRTNDGGNSPSDQGTAPGNPPDHRKRQRSNRSLSSASPKITVGHGVSQKATFSTGGIEVTVKATAHVAWSRGSGSVTVEFDPFAHKGRLTIGDRGLTITDRALYQQDARAMIYSLAHPGPIFPWNGSMALQKKWPIDMTVGGRKIKAEGAVTTSVYHSGGEIGGSVEVEVSRKTPKDGVVTAVYSIDISAKAKPGKLFTEVELAAAIALAFAVVVTTGAVGVVRTRG